MLISATTCTQLNSDSSERIERKRDKEVDKDKVVEPEAVMLNENKKRGCRSTWSSGEFLTSVRIRFRQRELNRLYF
uniref:Uncharacterized protein n=1 Tax=Rhizophagus irregularis (strain DAOM 181602 / DAOM 197198 / MUCL 43194) TaxID=747089 RepID=U9U159_RHIID